MMIVVLSLRKHKIVVRYQTFKTLSVKLLDLLIDRTEIKKMMMNISMRKKKRNKMMNLKSLIMYQSKSILMKILIETTMSLMMRVSSQA